MDLSSVTDPLRRYWDNLSDRERRLMSLLGIVFALLVLLGILYVSTSAMSDIEDESDQIMEVLRDVAKSRPQLAQREAERRAAERRYDSPAPPLGSFLEERARNHGLTIREVVDQPEKEVGAYRRRHVRVTLPGVSLRPVIDLMAAIENSPYPVAIERVQIEHFQMGDQYNVQLGVVAFDRRGPRRSSKTLSRREGGAAGPPPP